MRPLPPTPAAAAVLLIHLLLAGCGGGSVQTAPAAVDRPTVARVAFDARERVVPSDPDLLRLDDMISGAVFSADPQPPPASAHEWDFDQDAQGWSFVGGGVPGVTDGKLEWTVGGGKQGLISPLLDIPFRDLREIEITMRASAGSRLRLWWAENKVPPEGELGPLRRTILSLRTWWSGNNRFNTKYSVAPDIVPGTDLVRYAVKTSTLRGYEGMHLAWLRLDPTDGETADVAIESIRFVGREGSYEGKGHGITQENLGNEIRNALFHRAPSEVSWKLRLPAGARLATGAGLLDVRDGVTLSVRVEDAGDVTEVLRERLDDDRVWRDLDADLSRWGGREVDLVLAAESPTPGQVVLWSNPMIAPAPAAVAAGTPGTAEPHRSARRAKRPNVIFYMIDTLRSDHLTAYGYDKPTSPVLERLASEGALFERCSSAAPWTRPSVSSLLTSLAPPSHGVTNYGLALSEAVTTLQERFRMAGYVTAGFIASTHSGSSANLQQGYDFLTEMPVVSGGEDLVQDRETRDFLKSSAGINRAAFPWIEQHRDLPFYLYLHVMDPHAPYDPPPEIAAMFATGYTGPLDGDFIPETTFKNARTPEEIAYIRSLYDGDIRYNDEQIGLLVQRLSELGILDDTLLVFVSDHGEEFREHGHWEHGKNLHHEVIDVPVIMRLPSAIPAGTRGGDRISNLDIMPTVLDIAGLDGDEDMQGESLLPVIRSNGVGPTGELRGERLVFSWRLGDDGLDQVAVERGPWKLWLQGDGTMLLYDRSSDPDEQKDLAAADPGIAEDLAEHGRAWLRSRFRITTEGEAASVTIDEQEHKWLKALGYVD